MALIGFINRRTNMDIEQVEMAQVSTAIELNVKRFLETAGKERRITAAYLYGSHVLTVTALDRPGHAATKTETK